MVDKTENFLELCGISDPRHRVRRSPSPFVLNAADLFAKIMKMQRITQKSYVNYVGYHRFCNSESTSLMPQSDKISLDQSLALFIATCASSVHGLKLPQSDAVSARDHHKEILSFLLQVLEVQYFRILY
jgi:hypothetical protein